MKLKIELFFFFLKFIFAIEEIIESKILNLKNVKRFFL